jgi:hypothetical protein
MSIRLPGRTLVMRRNRVVRTKAFYQESGLRGPSSGDSSKSCRRYCDLGVRSHCNSAGRRGGHSLARFANATEHADHVESDVSVVLAERVLVGGRFILGDCVERTAPNGLPGLPSVAVVTVHVPIQEGLFNLTGADIFCRPIGPGCPSEIDISTVALGGSPIIGYNITLWGNAAQLAHVDTCYSYCSFFATNGRTYQVGAGPSGLGPSGIGSKWF